MSRAESEEEKENLKEKLERKKETITTIWELFMFSKVHREVLVMALDQKKIHAIYTHE